MSDNGNDWITHEIKKPINFSNIAPADFWKWARQGLAIPIFQEDVPEEEEPTTEEEEEDENEGIAEDE